MTTDARRSGGGGHWNGVERRLRSGSSAWSQASGVRVPSRLEQGIQFGTRYLFCLLALVFFNLVFTEGLRLIPLAWLNALLLGYLVVNTGIMTHAFRHPASPRRYRAAMWLDIVMVGVCLTADPNAVPPSALAFIMVVLGNGMRYGLRLFGEAVAGSLAGGMVAVSLRYLSADGLHPGLLFLNLFGGIILVYAYILMSRVEATHRALERRGQQDGLTGLLNRAGTERAAQGLLRAAQRQGVPFAVIFADLDGFKAINDARGHSEGDRVLREIASMLRVGMRDGDILGRFGGDEFLLLLPGTTGLQAGIVARRLQRRIEDWAAAEGVCCSISMGIGEVPANGADLETVLQHVDAAMYRVKRRGARTTAAGPAASAPT